jgi:hypothetical protein
MSPSTTHIVVGEHWKRMAGFIARFSDLERHSLATRAIGQAS